MQADASPDYPTRVGFEEALAIVARRAAMSPLPVQEVELAAALGRVLAGDLAAPGDVPPFGTSAMDGYALRGAGLLAQGDRVFERVGEVLAGATSVPNLQRGQCVWIATGAPVPPGADTVVVQEHVRVDGTRVQVPAGERAGANVRHAGELWRTGEVALRQGSRLDPHALSVLATLGLASVRVRRAPRIVVIATGSELVPAGRPLAFGQIHESNAVLLAAMARQSAYVVVRQACVHDDPAAIRALLLQASREADLVVTTGGMSAGKADYLPGVLADAGTIHFHKVRLRPCIPLLFGTLGDSLYFGLPGTPAGSATGFEVFVRHAVRALAGAAAPAPAGCARLAEALSRHRDQAELARCSLHVDDAGVQWATLRGKSPSQVGAAHAAVRALALLPEGVRELAAGEVVRLWPTGP